MGADLDTLPPLMFDPNSVEFQADPYPYYRRLREQAPIARGEGDLLVLSRYRDCLPALRGPGWDLPASFSCTSRSEGSEYENPNLRGLRDLFGGPTAEAGDDPERAYTRRRLVAKAFTRKGAGQRRDSVLETVNRLLNDVVAKLHAAGEADLVSGFTYPLVHDLACDLLGIPAPDRSAVRRWVDGLAGALDPVFMQTEQDLARYGQLGRELRVYMVDLVAQRRQQPSDDLLSAMIAAEEDGDRLSDDELVTTCCMLALAATGTTINFLSLASWSLLRNPDQLAAFRQHPEIAPTAVEELLRYDAPGQFSLRVATEDHELDGHRVRQGQYALILVACANRDPEFFADPDRLDLTRKDNQHLAFGQGRHHCLGAPFARLQSELALTTLVARIPNLALAGPPEVEQRFSNRGLARLPVSVQS